MKNKTLRNKLISFGVLGLFCTIAAITFNTKGKVDDVSVLRTYADMQNQQIVIMDDLSVALADISVNSTSLRSEAMRAFNLVNSERLANGLQPLVWDNNLESTSAVRAKECSQNFSHTRPNGKSWYTVNSAIMGGENLAYGYYDANSAINAWMDSPTHRENILWPEFTKVAISVYVADDGTYYWAQEFGY